MTTTFAAVGGKGEEKIWNTAAESNKQQARAAERKAEKN